MQAKLLFSPLALKDLDAIWDFLAVECGNTRAASKTVSNILDGIDRLSDLPESGTPLDAHCVVHSEYRFVVIGHHLAFYRFEDGNVYIDRILDGRSDYLRILFGTPGSGIDLYI